MSVIVEQFKFGFGKRTGIEAKSGSREYMREYMRTNRSKYREKANAYNRKYMQKLRTKQVNRIAFLEMEVERLQKCLNHVQTV